MSESFLKLQLNEELAGQICGQACKKGRNQSLLRISRSEDWNSAGWRPLVESWCWSTWNLGWLTQVSSRERWSWNNEKKKTQRLSFWPKGFQGVKSSSSSARKYKVIELLQSRSEAFKPPNIINTFDKNRIIYTRYVVSTSHSCQSLTQDGPKGCYDIGLPSKKPLFQIFAWLLVWLFHLWKYQRKEVHFAEHERVWPLESMQYLAISWAGGEDSAFGHHVQRGGILNVTSTFA